MSLQREFTRARPDRESPSLRSIGAAIPRELLESELFGFEKGAFTGAHTRKPGKFELANGGTILLNEIGEMDLSTQAKLLQVLQDGVYPRLGGEQDIQVIHLRYHHHQGSYREIRVGGDLPGGPLLPD